jgi:hypothetical protein
MNLRSFFRGHLNLVRSIIVMGKRFNGEGFVR